MASSSSINSTGPPPNPTPSPSKPIRHENLPPAPRKETSSPGIRQESEPAPVRNDAPLHSPVTRNDPPVSSPSPTPPVRRDTPTSQKSQKELPSPTIRKEVPVAPQRTESNSGLPTTPVRKNVLPKPSPMPPNISHSSSIGHISDGPGRQSAVDISQFSKEGFSHDEYLTKNLGTASEDTVRAFLQLLKDSKSLAAEDLQENVFKNYNEFVTISKEISKLESDMQVLRGHLDDLKASSDSLIDDDDEFLLAAGIEESAPVVPKRMTMMVSSMSDLTSVYKAQMMALWEGIDGAQKMLPYHPKRRLVRESPSFVEVNVSSNKIKHPVHIVLMNDALLVATRKKKTATHSKFKLVGDRCWALTDITIEDMKDTNDLRNAIKIKHGNEFFVYKTEKGQEKQSMLVNTKRATDDMLAKSNESRNKDTYGLPTMPNRAGMKFRASVGLSQSDFRWLAEFTDELDVLIAQREFDGAVAGVEKATVMLSQISLPGAKREDSRKRLDERVSRLARAILMDLGNPHVAKSMALKNVGWLERLGCLDQAKEVFLTSRTKVIRQRMGLAKSKRDPVVHIEELSVIVFTTIWNTCEWFEASFKSPKMTSSLVKWVKEEIENFADNYKDIVFGQGNFQVIADCFKIAQEQCSKLKEVGLDQLFVLETMLMPYLAEIISEHERRCLERMDAIIEHDDFAPMSGEDLGSSTPLSASMVAFYTVMMQFVNNACLIGNIMLYSRIVENVSNLFKAYVNRTIQVYEEVGLNNEQITVVNSNFEFISGNFISRVTVQLQHRFERPIPELETVREELTDVELQYHVQ
ncbi:exocyst complex component exo84 [Lunasporangiospora selenospora]|uniref:Exocyst complex component EXO84 n=1 Tax=Lunasporangiospora selenospora TaxID=979761 RepID=A0A9P6KDY0_9FUNG|nr:exocyst complex component exo84 [Lunasporangiospora selenospora]